MFLRRDQPTQHRSNLCHYTPPFFGRERSVTRAAKERLASTSNAFLNEVSRLKNRSHGSSVTFLTGITPGDESMFSQNHEPCMRIGSYRQCDLVCQTKTGTAIGYPDYTSTEAFLRQCLTIGSAREVVGGVSMRVINMRKWEKPVQQGLDRGARAARLIETVGEVIYHLGITHALAFQQGKYIIQVQPGKGRLRNACQV